jgi:predicted dehydrogenase
MAAQTLRIGIIGIGWYAGKELIPKLRETGKVEIVAIARRGAEWLALAQKQVNIREAYTDWREMLEKSALDAVVVCTPPNAHTEPTLAALERELHVFVEKPMALASADAQRMAEAAARADRILMVGYNTRGMGSWRTIKRKLSEGSIGTIEFYSDVFERGNWRTIPAARVAPDEHPFGSLVAIPERYSIGSGADLCLPSYSEHIFCTVVRPIDKGPKHCCPPVVKRQWYHGRDRDSPKQQTAEEAEHRL